MYFRIYPIIPMKLLVTILNQPVSSFCLPDTALVLISDKFTQSLLFSSKYPTLLPSDLHPVVHTPSATAATLLWHVNKYLLIVKILLGVKMSRHVYLYLMCPVIYQEIFFAVHQLELLKIKSVAYSSQGSQTGQLDFCN